MTIGILIFSEKELDQYTGAKRLEETAMQRGHEVVRFYEPFFSVSADEFLYQDKPIPHVDIIIARPNFIEEPSLHFYVINAFMKRDYPIINGKSSLIATKNKIEQLNIFDQFHLPYPKSFITKKPELALSAAKIIGFPVVIKVAFGTIGTGVFYAPDQETFKPIVEYLTIRDRNPIIVQEYIKEADRKDLRVFLVGGKIVATMERHAPEGDIRANTSSGGIGTAVILSQKEKTLAQRCAKIFDLEIAGVDLIRSVRGPLVIEINANPGFTELERVTQVDVANAIICYAEKIKRR